MLDVEFSLGLKAAYTIDNDGQITTTVPVGVSDGPITVSETSISSSSVTPFAVSNLTPLAPPRISSFHPAGLGVGATIQISGVGFTGATQLTFNGVKGDLPNVQSDTSMTAVVPAGATSGVLAVSTPRGATSSVDPFVVLVPPAITSLAPTTAKIGDTVTLTGTNLSAIGQIGLQFASTKPVTQSDTQLTFVVPPRSQSGPLLLLSPSARITTTQELTVQAAASPVVTSIYPLKGPPGSYIFVNGTFDSVDAVKFNGVDARHFFVTGPNQVFATTPNDVSTGPITVVNSQGTGTSPAPFTATTRPVVSSVVPLSGKLGDLIALVGEGFDDTLSVLFRDVTAFANVQDATHLAVPVPPGARTGSLRVQTQGRSAPATFTVVASDPPMLTDFAPASGGIGRYVELAGLHFTGLDEIRFNGTAARILSTTDDRAHDGAARRDDGPDHGGRRRGNGQLACAVHADRRADPDHHLGHAGNRQRRRHGDPHRHRFRSNT